MSARRASSVRGVATVNLLAFATLWTFLFGFFLAYVQWQRAQVASSVVHGAGARAAYGALTVLCADGRDFGGAQLGDTDGPRGAAIFTSVRPLLALVTPPEDHCHLRFTNAHGDPVHRVLPTQEVTVDLSCDVPCDIPFAASLMCSGSPRHLHFEARQVVAPSGCDIKGGV